MRIRSVKAAPFVVGMLLAMGSVSFLLGGCGGDAMSSPGTTTGSNSINTLVPSVYVGNMTASGQYQVLQFARGATGVSTPLATLTMASGFEITCLTTDASGQIYVGGSIASGTTYQWEVLVYAAGASGTDAPVRTVLGSSTSFQTVTWITTDASGQLYIATNLPTPRVAVMAANANGAATPVRLITGALTQLFITYGLAVDSGGTLYVSNSDNAAIDAFSPTANGNVAPVRVITGTNTGLVEPFGLDVDSSGNVYVLSVYQVPAVSTVTTLIEFSSTANGNATPLKTITGSNTGLNTFASCIRLDSTGTAYVSGSTTGITQFVALFSSTASGNVAPANSFTSTTWTGPAYLGVALR